VNGHLIATVSPDLIIDGALLEAGLEGNLGGLRYLGQGPDGGHIL
jgi:hypothetical protein